MTVRNDLDRTIAMAEASKGSYLLFATESEDSQAKQVFQDMADDMERHVQILKSRRDYLDQYNPLNAGCDDDSGGNGGGNGGGKNKNKNGNNNAKKKGGS